MVRREVDVLIVGAGIVGAALAASLHGSGLSVVIIEATPLQPVSDAWDTRIYAISPGSAALLDGLGAWDSMDATRIGPVQRMDVRGDQGARVVLDAYEAGAERLASIVESSRIQQALWRTLHALPTVTVLPGVQGTALRWSAHGALMELNDGNQVTAKLVVAADGRSSWVREQAGIESRRSDYQQLGVVANFVCARPHHQTAYQWFRADGVLAWLPLPKNTVSMVWSTDAAHAARLLALPEQALADQVAQAGARSLGDMRVLTSAAAFPLSLLRVASSVQPGLALIGDAAHGVHPLSGQGVNVGLRDVAELSRVLHTRGQASCGDLQLLRRYQRARRGDVLAIQNVTHGLHHVFRSHNPVLAALRNVGMSVIQGLGPLKSKLVQQAII